MSDDSVDMPVDTTTDLSAEGASGELTSELDSTGWFEEKPPNPVAVVLGVLCNIVYIIVCVKIKTSMDVDDVE